MREIIFGIHTVHALLKRNPQLIKKVFILKGRDDRRMQCLITELKSHGIIIQFAKRQWFDSQVKGAVHQGIIANIKLSKIHQEYELINLLNLIEKPFLLILDRITDPHNLGACLRNADASGVHAVIVPKDRSADLNCTVKKVASGAAENIPLIRVTNLVRTICLLKEYNIWIIGTVEKSDRMFYDSHMNGAIALVMGGEEKGIRRLTREHCDELISIPMVGSVTSLNVSVANGICLFEAVRQRNK
ncbi:23S rRNA (guanosine(2251)-2'-O)-methyltransferase RlmB [Pantoea sp. Aalb]|uniref:23S rRNA (guanosine(2251)-2'-O)-methyltransferase RlmB n=1 Tax=Pantoea sp. Aalb TaxID=2576762 RepID=UPI0013283A14|nr:23S rRNA (guanosine(2251)-2'-O)-methyltransferase RlmB [Pantoea sp. Aalb]MXP67683.1 23S rRNA (guanosine(2251)-2'-O)-methyltransferase RlmB [Pantoea sp. Aalb]